MLNQRRSKCPEAGTAYTAIQLAGQAVTVTTCTSKVAVQFAFVPKMPARVDHTFLVMASYWIETRPRPLPKWLINHIRRGQCQINNEVLQWMRQLSPVVDMKGKPI